MSLRRFNGWEPASETTYEYDPDGQLVRAVTVTEPEWDTGDRKWALALLELEADTCGGCGGPLTETTDADAEFGYEVPAPHRCHRCTALAVKRAEYREANHPEALIFTARRR